jgi:predicted metalloprotease with PDZ domain
MRRFLTLFFFSACSIVLYSQVKYTLIYKDSLSKTVRVVIQFTPTPGKQVNLVMPRSIPGGYQIYTYDKYLERIDAFSATGEKLRMMKNDDDAPRWFCVDTSKLIVRVEYEVNLDKMERQQMPGDASILRLGFAGLLNYSVFGWVDGTERQPAECTIETFDSWPIFTTNHPGSSPEKGTFKFNVENYYALADGQTFMGPRFRVKEYNGLVPLFVASYCETADEYLDDYAEQEIISMGILKDYFGELPFPYYSIMLRSAVPLETVDAPPLAMEHLQSSTFFGDTSFVRTAPMTKERIMQTIPTYLHHMGHAFIPLRCYGDSYKPHVEEIPPIINNIWFNEGFMWFLPYDTLKLERMKNNFYNNVYKTSSIIKKMSLQQLSQIASTMYGIDFRLGQAVFSRGAMMAIEMNAYIKKMTNGKKSMRDVFRYLYQWAKENRRPFTMDEFPSLLNKATGVDLTRIYERWQLPIK